MRLGRKVPQALPVLLVPQVQTELTARPDPRARQARLARMELTAQSDLRARLDPQVQPDRTM